MWKSYEELACDIISSPGCIYLGNNPNVASDLKEAIHHRKASVLNNNVIVLINCSNNCNVKSE